MHAIAAVDHIFDLIIASLLTFPTLCFDLVQAGNQSPKASRWRSLRR
jgi:hypothetical protein